MKIRNGFVSNSSSSSFVVHIRDAKYENQGKKKRYRVGKKFVTMPKMERVPSPLLITKKQMKALLKRGFKFGDYLYASRVEDGVGVDEVKPELATDMHRSVTCNEAEEVEFLVKHGIPFEAATHYGHYGVFFRPGSDRVWIARNLGAYIETYKNSLPLDKMDGESLTQERKNLLRSQTVKSILKDGWTK
jgi:hypothetical protein